MKMHAGAFVGLMLACWPGLAIAQVTQTYQYDGNGRLTGVTTTGSAGTNTAAYAYDDADNRTSRSQTGTSAWAALLTLPVDQPLQPNQALVSADGRHSFALRPSGQLELWSGDATTRSPLGEAMSTAFLLDGDGQARFRPHDVAAGQLAGARLSLSNDGDLVLVDRAEETVLWTSGTSRNQEASQ